MILRLIILKVDNDDCTITMFLYMYFTWSEPRLDLPAKFISKNEYISLDIGIFIFPPTCGKW